MATIDTIRQYFADILQRSGSEVTSAEINSYVSAVDSGALTLAQVRVALIQSPEGQDVQDVVRLYQTVFGRVPDKAGLNDQVDTLRGPATESDLANSFANSPEFISRFGGNTVNTAFINAVYQQVLGRTPSAGEVDFYLNSGFSAGRIALAFSESPEFQAATSTAVVGFLDAAGQGTAVYTGSLGGTVNVGTTFTLTTGLDNFQGTAQNDTFVAGEVTSGGATTSTITTGDTIDGGAGADTLNIVQTAAFAGLPTGATVSNVETVNVTSGGAITLNTTSGFNGLTQLNTTTSANAQTLTAAATTDVKATANALGANAVSVDGGKNVVVNANGGNSTNADVTVGATTAAVGTVDVNYTGATLADGANATAQTNGDIAVTGGTKVNVTSTGAASGGSDDAGDVLNLGDVTVTGNASTTDVSVTQTAAQARVANTGGGTNGRAAITNGDVTITDVNAGSATAAGTIASVTLNSYGTSTIDSSALTSVTLSGTGGTLGIGRGALTATPTANTLALNVAGLTAGAITDSEAGADDGFTTINLNSTGTASTIADLVAADATTLNIAGDAKVTLTAQTLNSATSISVTNTAGASLGTQLGNNVSFTGGAGADAILLGQTTKAINMGAGDDVVTLSNTTLGAGGSVNGGQGNDTIVANTNGSSFSANPAVAGFETLRVAGGAAQGTHNANGFTALEVGALNGAVTFTNVAANVGLTVLAAPTASTTVELANATGTSDVFNLAIKSAATIDADTVTLAGVETVNILSDDTETGASATANINKLVLEATSAQSIVVTGDAGLDVNNAGNVAVTNFDASAVTGTGSAVTFVSANTTAGAVVTIKGGAGGDSLTGSASANDTIFGNDGNDTLVYDGGADVFNGGAGNDIFDVNATGTKAAFLTIADAANGDKIDFADVGTIADGALGAKVTLGAAATLDQYLDAAAAGTANAKWFQFNGDTYIVADNDAGAAFVSGTDAVVKLTGVYDLSNDAFAGEVLTIA